MAVDTGRADPTLLAAVEVARSLRTDHSTGLTAAETAELPGGVFDGSGTLDEARTAGFTVLVLAQLFNCFNSRSERVTAFHHLFTNPLLLRRVGSGRGRR